MKLKIKKQLSSSLLSKFYINAFSIRHGMRTYEPTPYLGLINKLNGKRASSTIKRWKMMKPELEKLNPSTIIDFGCSEGYFVMMSAKTTGAISVGVDADVNRLVYATHQQVYSNDLTNVGFIRAEIDKKLFNKIPMFDVSICLSVLHHILYEHGYDYSLEFLKSIRQKTKKALFFETGNSKEISMKWAERLPDMGEDPNKWVAQLLKDAGFKSVRHLGDTPSYNNETKRGLFIARP